MYITLYEYTYEKIRKMTMHLEPKIFDHDFSADNELDDRPLKIRIPNFVNM